MDAEARLRGFRIAAYGDEVWNVSVISPIGKPYNGQGDTFDEALAWAIERAKADVAWTKTAPRERKAEATNGQD